MQFSRYIRGLSWAAVAAMLVAALVGPGAAPVMAAPVNNDNACNNVKAGSDGVGVTVSYSSAGIVVAWSLSGTPTVVRACAFDAVGGTALGGAWDQSPSSSATSELFTWEVLGISDPCLTNSNAAFRGSLDITGVANTVKGNWASCGSTPTPSPTPTPTPTATVAPTSTPTAIPKVTLPATDTIAPSGPSSTGNGYRVLLVATAVLLALVLLVTPAPRRRRR